MRTALAALVLKAFAIVCLVVQGPQAHACSPAPLVLQSSVGQTFAADAYARIEWQQRSSGGRIVTYARQIWRGSIGGRTAYLTFDEIPGTSGPNYAMQWTYRYQREAKRPEWRAKNIPYDLDQAFVILSGPLKGGWRVMGC